MNILGVLKNIPILGEQRLLYFYYQKSLITLANANTPIVTKAKQQIG